MILYRAITDEDLQEFNEKKEKEMSCMLKRSYANGDNKCLHVYDMCYIRQDRDYKLGLLYGHINGRLAKAKRSPWISITSNFDRACHYAVSGGDTKDYEIERKHIICFEINDENIIKNADEFESKDCFGDNVIDLSTGQLAIYRQLGLINPITVEKSSTPIGTNFSVNNYSIADSHFVIYDKLSLLNKNWILITPNKQIEVIKQSIDNPLLDKNEFFKAQLAKKLA